jgi:replication-associated recombination protein RarA
MEDWIARAINPAENHTQKDAAVAKDALTCNRWIASSALQKALRRGDTAIAQRAAFALHPDDRSATWRRLIAIAFEDIGPADVDVVLETVAIATLPEWRAVILEEEVLRSIVATLATAPNCVRCEKSVATPRSPSVCAWSWTVRVRFLTALSPPGSARASITPTSIALAQATLPR